VIKPRKGEIEERVAGDTSVVGEECIQGASLVNVELGIISWGIIKWAVAPQSTYNGLW